MACLACCRFNLHTALEEKCGTLPERLYINVARLCSEANIRVEWHMEGFVCPKECKAKDSVKLPVMLTLLPDVQFHYLSAQLDDLEIASEEIGNGDRWEKAESHLFLTSSHFGGTHYRKILVICEDPSIGKEATSIPCVIDEDLVDPSTYALFKQGNDLIIKMYMQNLCYITKRLWTSHLASIQRVHNWDTLAHDHGALLSRVITFISLTMTMIMQKISMDNICMEDFHMTVKVKLIWRKGTWYMNATLCAVVIKNVQIRCSRRVCKSKLKFTKQSRRAEQLELHK